MKIFQLALIATLLCAPAGHALADPRPSSAGKSTSFKGGFSSQKKASDSSKRATTTPRYDNSSGASNGRGRNDSAAPPGRSSGGFGSFSKGSPDTSSQVPVRSRSALSRELEQKNAEANALRTLDERRAARNAPPPLPPLNPVEPRNRPQPEYDTPSYNQQRQNGPLVQRSDSGIGGVVTGYVLGRLANSGNRPAGMNQNSGQNSGQHSGQNTGNAPVTVPNPVGNGPTVTPATPAATPSFGGSALRTFVWLALLGAAGWLLYFGVKRLRGGKARDANYSFERH